MLNIITLLGQTWVRSYFRSILSDFTGESCPARACVCVRACLPEVAVNLIITLYKNTRFDVWNLKLLLVLGIMLQVCTLLYMHVRAHPPTGPSSQQLQQQRVNRCLSECPLHPPAARTTGGPGGLGASSSQEGFSRFTTTTTTTTQEPSCSTLQEGRRIIRAWFATCYNKHIYISHTFPKQL